MFSPKILRTGNLQNNSVFFFTTLCKRYTEQVCEEWHKGPVQWWLTMAMVVGWIECHLMSINKELFCFSNTSKASIIVFVNKHPRASSPSVRVRLGLIFSGSISKIHRHPLLLVAEPTKSCDISLPRGNFCLLKAYVVREKIMPVWLVNSQEFIGSLLL